MLLSGIWQGLAIGRQAAADQRVGGEQWGIPPAPRLGTDLSMANASGSMV